VLDCYDFTPDEVSYLAAIMMFVGIVSAGFIGAYIEKTLKYRKVFIPLALFGIIQCIALPIMLIEIGHSFPFAAIIVLLQGVIFIPLMPLSFDYGCDILFPAGEAQITGCLMTSGNFIGLVFVLLSNLDHLRSARLQLGTHWQHQRLEQGCFTAHGDNGERSVDSRSLPLLLLQ
jgi:MFS transporter, FLVCR family, feline leukemia virus subgroup C receptor-related protein